MFTDVFQPLLRFKQFASARFKLVFWFVLVLGVLLIVFASSLIGIAERNMYSALNERLVTNTEQVADLVELREGKLLFKKLDQLNVENQALRTYSVQMFDTKGDLLWQASRNQLPASESLQETLETNQPVLSTMSLPFERYRVLTRPVRQEGEIVGVMQAGLSLRDSDDAIAKIIIVALFAIPVALILAALGGWFLAAKALKPIEENLANQRQFIQDASHELRTPLAIIQSNIDVALQNPNPNLEHLQTKLKTIRETTLRMGQIIGDLSTLSTSDSQSLRLRPQLITLDKVVKEVVKQMRSLARKKNQNLELESIEELIVYADELRIKQVLTILIDNAIKYCPEKSRINVSVNKTPAIDYAKISVTDNGPGISKDDQEKIFDRFYRVDKSRSRELGGHGLGLAIAKTLVEKQRGYLSLQSKLGEGTSFNVFLPLVAKKSIRNLYLSKIFSRKNKGKNIKSANEKLLA